MTRTALSACAGLVCTLTTACLPQNVYRGMFIAVRRIEVPTGPAPDATLSHRRSPSASEHAVAERLTVAVLAGSWEIVLAERNSGPRSDEKTILFGGQKQKSATPRRPVDLACESTAMLIAGTSAAIGSFSTMLQLFATQCNCLQAWKMTHSRGWVESESLARIAAAGVPETSRIACWIRTLADLQHLFRRRTD